MNTTNETQASPTEEEIQNRVDGEWTTEIARQFSELYGGKPEQIKSETREAKMAANVRRFGIVIEDLRNIYAGQCLRVINLEEQNANLKAMLKHVLKALEDHHAHDQKDMEVFFEQDGKPIEMACNLGEAYSESELGAKTSTAIYRANLLLK